jgi:gamma-glutamyl-gamma-aminobutyrate hydrolase PuuD
VCVQYHPEDLIDRHAPSQRLLETFVNACWERLPSKVRTARRQNWR